MAFRAVLQCYAIDSEMFVGDQRFTEPFLQEYLDDLKKMTSDIEKDFSFCCFGCLCRKKNQSQKVGAYDAEVDYNDECEFRVYCSIGTLLIGDGIFCT